MPSHKIIRNTDGSAYVVDSRGKHVATHDSAAEAKEHLEKLHEEQQNEHSEIKRVEGELHHHEKMDKKMHASLKEHESPYWKGNK